jgi:hypothetical protein
LRANWWGLLTERITKNLGRIGLLKGLQEEISGIPGSEQDHHAAPYYLTEEFVSVYRMHPLIPDDYRFYSVKSDEFLEERTFTEIQGNHPSGYETDSYGTSSIPLAWPIPGSSLCTTSRAPCSAFKELRMATFVASSWILPWWTLCVIGNELYLGIKTIATCC